MIALALIDGACINVPAPSNNSPCRPGEAWFRRRTTHERSSKLFGIEQGVPFARAPEFTKRRLLQLGIASALATGIVAAASVADARTTQIKILTRTTAFGGYSFPGVGQYEVITGIATGEVNPNDLKNAVITDISRADTPERQRHVPA
jgi:hypothetical protein